MSKQLKPLNVRDRYLNELILLGGKIMTRGEAAARLTREGVPRSAIDRCVYGVSMLNNEELCRLVRTELIFQLRLRYQGIFRERARAKNDQQGKTRGSAKD